MTYDELIREFPLRPLKSEKDLDRALEITDRLVAIDRNEDEDDYFVVLFDIIWCYENENDNSTPLTPGQMLKGLLENRGMTASDLAKETALSQATISHVITGRRLPSRKVINALSSFFKVDPSCFL